MQIIDGNYWTSQANKQHYFYVYEPFSRGKFISNSPLKRGHPEKPQSFVMDILKFHLHVDPESIPDRFKEFVITNLVKILHLTKEEQLSFREQFDKKSHDRKLAMWLEKETKEDILKWWNPFAKKNKIPLNALFFVNDYQRSYPYGPMLGQVLHTIQSQKDEKTKQGIPTGGLELYFDDLLKGKNGKKRLMRSPRNAIETQEIISLPQNGADIYLTINHGLQAIAEEEIAKGVRKAKAKSGWAVAMNPKTGEILALAQYPFFYPSDYKRFFNNPNLMEHTKVKAVTDAQEPGSILKAITLAVALKANLEQKKKGKKPLFNPHEMVPTSNSQFPGRAKPLVDTHLHHYLNMYLAFQKSSNIYLARLMEKVVNEFGNEFYRDILCDTFGFGKKTNIELPGESAGLVPKPGKKHPNGCLEWSVPTPFSLAMGHNIMVNSIQMLRAYSVFANGGYLVEPTIVKKIVRKDSRGIQEIIKDNTSENRQKKFPKVLEDEIIKEVVTCLKYSTKQGGTSSRANIWGYTEAGKTGTAKKIENGNYCEKVYFSSFIGFTPVNDPAFVLIVTMDEPEYGFIPGVGKKHHGGFCSAPVFREISQKFLAYLGIPPDDPYGYPKGDPRFDEDKADWYPEVKKMRQLYNEWNNPHSG